MDEKQLKQKQVDMHKNFFDDCNCAIENGFYLEAIFLEYAAIESRLEIMCGLLALPCNKDLPANVRKDIAISHRIECIKRVRNKNSEIFKRSKLDKGFFKDNGVLAEWIKTRNMFIHGLYKNAGDYKARKRKFEELAIKGEKLARALYNEVSRLRRLLKSHPELFVDLACPKKSVCFEKKK